MENRKIKGFLDEYGFPYLIIDIKNPTTEILYENAKAIIDTGAAYSHIKPFIAKYLKLNPSGEKTIKHLTDGDLKSNKFRVSLKFTKKIEVPDIDVGVITQKEYPSDIIIGLDIIKYCDFHYLHKKEFLFELFPDV